MSWRESVWVHLVEPSVLPVPEYLFPSLGFGIRVAVLPSEIRLVLGFRLSNCQQWPLLPHLGYALGPRVTSACLCWVFSWFLAAQIQCQAVVWSEGGWGIHSAQTREHEEAAAARADHSLPCLGASQYPHTPHKLSLGFSNFSICLSQAAKGACLLLTGPGDRDSQSVAWPAHSPGWVSTCALSFFFLDPSHDHRSQLDAFLPISPDYLCIFLTALVL